MMKNLLAKFIKNSIIASMALIISYGVFLFMYSFVIPKVLEDEVITAFDVAHITIPKEDPPEPKKEQQQDDIEEMPQTPSLRLDPVVLITQMPSVKLPNIAPNLATNELAFDQAASLNAFSTTSGVFNPGNSKVRTGKKHVPYSSVQPNIPEIAWINRLNGTVEVSLSINQQGKVTHVDILNSAPQGIFEEAVIKAVYRWAYPPYIVQGKAQAIKLRQKIELFWRDYPNNVAL